jgi:hypothetical protein
VSAAHSTLALYWTLQLTRPLVCPNAAGAKAVEVQTCIDGYSHESLKVEVLWCFDWCSLVDGKVITGAKVP